MSNSGLNSNYQQQATHYAHAPAASATPVVVPPQQKIVYHSNASTQSVPTPAPQHQSAAPTLASAISGSSDIKRNHNHNYGGASKEPQVHNPKEEVEEPLIYDFENVYEKTPDQFKCSEFEDTDSTDFGILTIHKLKLKKVNDPNSVAINLKNIQTFVKEVHAFCPKAAIAILGFIFGASVEDAHFVPWIHDEDRPDLFALVQKYCDEYDIGVEKATFNIGWTRLKEIPRQ